LFLAGCETHSATLVHAPLAPDRPRVVRIEPCQDRTGHTDRDLAGEATRALTERIRAAGLFEIAAEAPLLLSCDVERFVEGSALKRWVLPGWGGTRAYVAVSVWEQSGDRLLTTVRSQAVVESGGLYTIGADGYILGVAFDDVITQLRRWAGEARR
jgi:hypothetical protein